MNSCLSTSAVRIVLVYIVALLVASCGQRPEDAPSAGSDPLTIEEGYFQSMDGLRLFYRKVGSGGETAVYLHGGPWNMSDGGYELDALAAERVLIAFDQRSGGRSDLVNEPERLTAQDFVQDVEALRRHFRLEKMTLIGQSWGAGLATLYTAAHPERVDRLLLLSPMPPAQDPYWAERVATTSEVIGEDGTVRIGEIAAEMAAAPDEMIRELCEEQMRLMFRAYLTDITALDRMKVGYCEASPAATRHQSLASGAALASLGAWDFRPDLGRMEIPVLVVEGEDTHVPLEATIEWARSAQNGRMLLIPRANHMTWLEGDLDYFFSSMNVFLGGRWPENARMVSRQ